MVNALDPYDLRHPMWTDPFWAKYCGRSAAIPAPTGTGRQVHHRRQAPARPGRAQPSPTGHSQRRA